MRLSKIEYGAYLALAARSRSEDHQVQTGCVLFDENWKTVGTGFNGFAPKFIPDQSLFENRELKSEVISHAEINAIINCTKPPRFLFTVLSPCVSCAKTISATSTEEVYYIQQYLKGGKVPDEKFKMIFDLYGIKYRKITKEELFNVKAALSSEIDKISTIYENSEE